MSGTIHTMPSGQISPTRLVLLALIGLILWCLPVMLGTIAYWRFIADGCR